MQLDRVRHTIPGPAAGPFHGNSIRWLASFLIMAVVFFFAPSAAPEWRLQSIVPIFMKQQPAASLPTFQQWGAQALSQIQSTFRLSPQGGYAEQVNAGRSGSSSAAFLWSRSIHFAALVAAARVDPSYIPRIKQDANSLRAYWVESDGRAGFDVLPGPKPADRYYDDNAWMALGFLDAYELTGEPQYLAWARDTFNFVLTGEDEKQGGGIYWREQVKGSKNACSTAPAALAALRLYQVTGETGYLANARELYAWMNARLQDGDHLFFDNITVDGRVDTTKWSYNSALMIEVNVEMHRATGEYRYLDEAVQIARAAESHWVDGLTGAIVDDAAFAQHLADAFLVLYRQTGDRHWRDQVERAVRFLHDRGSDQNGYYGSSWGAMPAAPLPAARLIDAASAARAYWLLAGSR